jgi:acetyl-CoA C-acetyltransferase
LAGVHPADLGAGVLRALVDRVGVDPVAVDDVVMGCVSQVGPQALDLARTAWLSAGLPDSVPGVTIDRQCGSSQQAVHFGAQGVMSGTQDLLHELERSHGRYGLQTMCEGGGQANATIIERLN